MKKELIEATAAKLVVELKEFYEVTGAFAQESCITEGFEIEVQMMLDEFNEAFYGSGEVSKRSNTDDDSWYPYEKELVVGGIKFFCLLKKEEAKEIRDE